MQYRLLLLVAASPPCCMLQKMAYASDFHLMRQHVLLDHGEGSQGSLAYLESTAILI